MFSASGPGARRAAVRVALFVVGVTGALATRPARALDPEKPLGAYTVRVWRAADGLAGDNVQAIAQTTDGYLWIAGSTGLARYDGGGFELVYPRKDTVLRSLLDQDVRKILARRTGPLWMATAGGSGGLVLYGGRMQPIEAGVAVGPKAVIRAMHEDRQGVVWLVTHRGDLIRLDGTTATTTRLPRGTAARPVVLNDARGRVWVGGLGGLFVRQAPGESFALGLGPGGPVQAGVGVRAIHEDRSGGIWVGADRALWRFDGERFAEAGPGGGDVGVGRIEDILDDRDGSVWIAGATGLARYRQGRIETFRESDGLPDPSITALFEDHEGSLWVGTYAGGIAQFTDRTLPTASQPDLREAWIDAVCEDAQGRLWLGVRGRQGPALVEDGRVTWVAKELQSSMRACLPRPDGSIWLGTTDGGLALWRAGEIERRLATSGMVTALAGDGDERLWVGTAKGLERVEGRDVHSVGMEQGLPRQRISTLSPDRAGNLWVGVQGRLWRQSAGRFELVPDLPNVRSVYHDDDDATWLATVQGLYRVDARRRQRFEIRATFDLTLPPDPLHQILSDRAGHLWLMGSHHILRVARRALDEYARGLRRELEVVAFDTSDRRRGIVVSRDEPAAVEGADGRLHFATRQGLVSFDPAGVTTNALPPPIVVQKVVVDGLVAPPGASFSSPPGSGTVEIHYAALSFQEPQKNRFRYRLDGFDDRWNEAGVRRAAFYTNVPPGRYRFQVQGSNNDGVWNTEGASFALTLAPRFHQTGLFLALCVAAGLALVWFAYHLRLRALRTRYTAVLAERTRVARDLHDTLLQSMTAVWAELGAVTSRLPDAASAERGRLRAVADVVAKSLEDTRHFVADLRDRAGGKGDLARALTLLARRLSRQGAVPCTVEAIGVAWTLPQQVASELYRIAQEALRNALKHAGAGRVTTRLEYGNRTITMVIKDDGRGFDPTLAHAPAHEHFGLLGLRERAERIGATLSIESALGAGTTVTVTWRAAGRGLSDG